MNSGHVKVGAYPLSRHNGRRSGKLRPDNKITFDYNKLFVTDKSSNTVVHVSKVDDYVYFKAERRRSSKHVSPIKSESTAELTTVSAPGQMETTNPLPTSPIQSETTIESCSDPNITYFTIYKHMQPQTIIISVEHCHSCEDHPMTLRHNEQEYLDKSEAIIRQLAERIHSSYPCVQVGVMRVPAIVDRRGEGSVERMGALEVQIAYASADYEQKHNTPDVELLHSKLGTRRWPSRVVLEKRLQSFLSRQQSLQYFHHIPGAGEREAVAAARNAAFSWYSCPLANPRWESKAATNKESSMESDVTWVFDYRVCSLVGETVEVSRHRLPFTPPAQMETDIQFSGHVVGVEKDVSTGEWVLLVVPRFADECVACPMSCCRPWQYHPRRLHCADSEMWTVLRTVMRYASEEREEPWSWKLRGDDYAEMVADDEEVGGDVRMREVWLTPTSYYCQVGQLAWEILLNRLATAAADTTSTPPASAGEEDCASDVGGVGGALGEDGVGGAVPVQLVYSEEAVDWLFGQSAFIRGGLVNVTRLCKQACMQPSPGLPAETCAKRTVNSSGRDADGGCDEVAGEVRAALTEHMVREVLTSAVDLFLYNNCGCY
jgi:hypothetical protein